MADLISPDNSQAITSSGMMVQRFFRWVGDITAAVNGLTTLTGTGSPEGAVTASAGRYYVDTAAAQGLRQWFKETGDGNTGWIQL